jgi:CheY-like chemotaxis protein
MQEEPERAESTEQADLTAPPQASRSHHHAIGIVRPRLLVVDDEPLILAIMAEALAADFDVVTCSDPREVIRQIQAGVTYDVIISDISMPHLTGIELYEHIAARAPTVAARFMFVSGDLDRPEHQGFFAGIGNPRFSKPARFAVLRDAARRVAQTS